MSLIGNEAGNIEKEKKCGDFRFVPNIEQKES